MAADLHITVGMTTRTNRSQMKGVGAPAGKNLYACCVQTTTVGSNLNWVSPDASPYRNGPVLGTSLLTLSAESLHGIVLCQPKALVTVLSRVRHSSASGSRRSIISCRVCFPIGICVNEAVASPLRRQVPHP